MISVDEAIARSTERWHLQHSHTQNETAYLDRTVLAAEVIALRTALTEAEREIHTLQSTLERTAWM